MGIKRFIADADTTITNAFKQDLVTRGTGSTMGQADVVEVFSIYGQTISGSRSEASSSAELSRALFRFPVSDISSSRLNGNIPTSGNVGFHLKLYNAEHAFTLPKDFRLVIAPVSQSWQEGFGLDMENYSDVLNNSHSGSDWLVRSSGSSGISRWGQTQASASLTFSDTSGVVPEAGDTVTISDGTTSKAYLAAAAQDLTTDPPKWHASNTATTQVDSLQACIESENGHNGTIVVEQDSTGLILRLTQATAGTAGNVTITKAGATDSQLGLSGFSSGEGDIPGGKYHTKPRFTASFPIGHEDLGVDITDIVEQWLIGGDHHNESNFGGGKYNYGVGVFLTGTQEAYHSTSVGLFFSGTEPHNVTGSKRSYYTKKFFARSSEFFFKRPMIEARWDSSTKDDRGNFFTSGALASPDDNLNTLYLYNSIRGQLKDIPNITKGDPIYVTLWTSASAGEQYVTGSPYNLDGSGSLAMFQENVVTGGWVASGTYSASFALTTTGAVVYDKWFSGAAGTAQGSMTYYHTGSFKVTQTDSSNINPTPQYVTKITNLKSEYRRHEQPIFRLFVRKRNWSPNIYTKVSTEIENKIVEDAYYKVYRVVDDLTIVNFGTGSANKDHTRLSFDVSGSYFSFDMGHLEAGYAYGIKFAYYVNGNYIEQPENFKFRVEEAL